MLDLQTRFDRSGYRLHPGPLQATEPLFTIVLQDIVEYPYSSLAAAILAYRGCREVRSPKPDWSQWQAEWQRDGRVILLNMLPEEEHLVSPDTDQPFWSGCDLVCDCLVGDLIGLWETVRRMQPAVWLCDGGAYGEISSRLFSPATFLAMPRIA